MLGRGASLERVGADIYSTDWLTIELLRSSVTLQPVVIIAHRWRGEGRLTGTRLDQAEIKAQDVFTVGLC